MKILHKKSWSEEFWAEYSILGVQRNLKILGVFVRKFVQEQDSRYLRYLPRVLGYIRNDLEHPLLLPLSNWFKKVGIIYN